MSGDVAEGNKRMTMEEIADAYREAVRRCYGDAILRYSSISFRGRWFYIGSAQRNERGSIISPSFEYVYNKEQMIEMTEELMKRSEQQEQGL